MDESKWKFILDNYGLIITVKTEWKKRFGKKSRVENEEIESAALYLAVKCMSSWDPARGNFSTYYFAAAKRDPFKHMIFNTQYNKNGGPMYSLNKNVPEAEDGEDGIDLLHALENLEEYVESKIMSDNLHKAINRLPDRLKEHALQTLEGTVVWRDLKGTVALRRETLSALRKLLTDTSNT